MTEYIPSRRTVSLAFVVVTASVAVVSMSSSSASDLRTRGVVERDVYSWYDKCTGKTHTGDRMPEARTPKEAAYMRKCFDGYSISSDITIKHPARRPR